HPLGRPGRRYPRLPGPSPAGGGRGPRHRRADPDGSLHQVSTTEKTETEESRVLSVPRMGLVLLVGVTGSGKSTFAARHFLPAQVVGSDDCRGMVSDDPNDQRATADAFALLNTIVG